VDKIEEADEERREGYVDREEAEDDVGNEVEDRLDVVREVYRSNRA
jgi:hypothetical protein